MSTATTPTTPSSTSSSTSPELPLTPGNWTVDTAHTGIHFTVRHLGLSKVRGHFKDIEATVSIGESLEDTAVDVTVDLASVDTNQPDRDAHLRSTDFFSADEHPKMTFRSTGVHGDEDGYTLHGDLTLNGITRPVSFDVELVGVTTNPLNGSVAAGFEATGEIRRKDFGIDFDVPLAAGGFVVGEKVKIEIDTELIAPE